MDLQTLFLRFDESTYAQFLSNTMIEVLKQFDHSMIESESLRNLIIDKIPKSVMLRDRTMRHTLFKALNKDEALALATHLEISHQEFDVYDKILQFSFRKYSSTENKIFNFFNIPIPEPEPISDNVPVETSTPKRYLFDHQYDAMKNILSDLEHKHRTLLHMPTGAGKTRTAMHVVSSYFQKKKSSLIIWLAYSEELCEQAISEFKNTWEASGDRPVQIIRFFGNYSPDVLTSTKEHDGVFIVAGLSKMYNHAQKNAIFLRTLADRSSLIVMDEAHQAVAETYRFILDQLVYDDSIKLLGLSATPGRTWNNPDIDRKLSEFFNKNKVTLQKSDPIGFLTKMGYLSKCTSVPIPYDFDILTESEQTALTKSLDIPQGVLEKLASETQRNFIIIKKIEDLVREDHKRIIVFAATINHAKDLALILSARGHIAYYIRNDTPSIQRRTIIDDFLNDDMNAKILCNYGVLTMGFDAPKTSAVVIARPTKSLVLYSQMVGRAIRGPKAGGNKKSTVITIADTQLSGFGSVTDAFGNWDDVWH